jgi:alanyl-tRNA synthetase
LDFFKNQGHAIVPSSSIVPENDPTTLFTGSGMQPMMPYLLGAEHPEGNRIVDSQKCFRSQDIEEVGDNRHTTYFEMLGNWSLGDYFKKEQQRWFFEFLVDVVGLPPEKLHVTVFAGNEELSIPADEEAVSIWQELFAERDVKATAVQNAETKGMQGGRIFYYPESKNWWSRAGEPKNMPVGEPGGPDSEVFFDFGPDWQLHENSVWKAEPCHVNCDCGRFLEIGNNVFMTYQRTESGFELLAQKNIDFGGGFERILAAQNNNPDVFTTELFQPIIRHLEKLSGVTYTGDSNDSDEQAANKNTQAFRVITDHVRAAVMLASDGVFPGNKEQGYFSRRLLRRAIRFGKQLGIEQHFLADLVPVITDIYAQAYPEVVAQKSLISDSFEQEENKFAKALRKGLKEIEKMETLSGETAFYLYETYGFPFELTQEIAVEQGQSISHEEFDQAKKAHAQESRTASAGKFKGGLAEHSEVTTKYHTATHLLHAALRTVLGEHVQQQGSNITNERLRFDFSHPQAMTTQEKEQVEQLMNSWVEAELPVTNQSMAKQDALDSGAIAFFREKYPDQVTVYTIGVNAAGPTHDLQSGWISKELCGGPHVTNTSEIGQLKLKKEQSASAGVRRVYVELS